MAAQRTPRACTEQRSAAAKTRAALRAIDAWGNASSTATYNEDLHRGVASVLLRLSRRRASCVDPFRIPMA
ncbi:hypothetical protein R2APBS1_1922 [Rhodanobacter denitrificans]|uniref:Uncharacterized protein n=1 Tax=Rhodanobacter denitrificans TaxID=666685 RepID=M4NE43_9GAMM|nr:hypothetical protein R2APBS1_1922 [Rhodanobacter denitrificans]